MSAAVLLPLSQGNLVSQTRVDLLPVPWFTEPSEGPAEMSHALEDFVWDESLSTLQWNRLDRSWQ